MAERIAIRTGFSCFLMQSEGELEPGGQRQPRRGFLHLLLRKGLGLVRCIINGSCHEVFEHFLVIRIARKKLRIDFNAPGFVLAGDRDFHGARTGFTGHFNVAELSLKALNVFLHFLGLRQQSLNVSTHKSLFP